MANYLERVASSASRRAAIARPPNSGPPVLPAGKDLSFAVEDPFASEPDQFLETLETHAPVRSAEIATPKLDVTEESTTTPTQDPKSVTSVVPKTRPLQERLSSEAPFTIQVPRTLRPSSAANVPPSIPNEAPRERPRVRPSTIVGPEEFKVGEEPASIIRSTESDVKEPEDVETTALHAGPKPRITDRIQEPQAPLPREVHTESAIAPIPRVDRVDGPPRLSVAEPSPPQAQPVHVPPVAATATRQEQSRITIGSLEVLVNNHPKVTTTRSAPAPSRSEQFNLEKRYLDRFRLRH